MLDHMIHGSLKRSAWGSICGAVACVLYALPFYARSTLPVPDSKLGLDLSSSWLILTAFGLLFLLVFAAIRVKNRKVVRSILFATAIVMIAYEWIALPMDVMQLSQFPQRNPLCITWIMALSSGTYAGFIWFLFLRDSSDRGNSQFRRVS